MTRKTILKYYFVLIFLLSLLPLILFAEDEISADEKELIALLDKYKAHIPDIAQKMMNAKADDTVELGQDEDRLIAETSSFFNELLTMKKGTQAYQSLRGKLPDWKANYLGIERALMMGRALIVQKVLKNTLIQFYKENPEAIGTVYGKMDIGTWVKMQIKTLQFDKDIDLSSLATDDHLNMKLRDMFKQNLQKITNTSDEKIMINMDALITPHGKASSEVFIGEWGKTFAEMDLLSRGKWQLILLKLDDGTLLYPDEAKRIREQGGAIKIVDIVTKEMPGNQLFWWRAFMEGKDFDPPRVTMKTEPMLSLEMSRHLIADIEKGNYSGIDKLMKIMKYVERSYIFNKQATAGYRGEWDPFDDNDRVLGEFAVELTKAKQAKENAAAELAKVMDKYKDKLNLGDIVSGDKKASDRVIDKLLGLSKKSIAKNAEVALALRLREIASVKDENERNQDLDDMLEQMHRELETYKEHTGDYPEGRIKDIIWLSEKLRQGDKWSAEVVRETIDDLIEALREENYQINKGVIEYIFSPDDARQLRLYLREQMKWTNEKIDKFIEDLRKKYPSLAKGYDRLKKDYQDMGKDLPTFAKIHKKMRAFNEDWSNTIEGSNLLSSLDFADQAVAIYDAYMSEATHAKGAVKAAGAIIKIKATGAFPSLSVAEGILQAYQEGDTGPAIKSFAFYYFPTIGAFWGLGEHLQRFDVFVRDTEFLSYLEKMKTKLAFDPQTGHIMGIKTISKYGEFLEYKYSPDQQQRAENFADFFMKSDNLISGDALPEFRFWMTLIPRSSERYGYSGDFVNKGDEALQGAGQTWAGGKLGLGSMDISGKKAKYAKLKKYFSYNEDLITAVLILENKNNAPGLTSDAGPKLAQKRDEMIQSLETNVERAMWKSLFYLLEASATPPQDLGKLIKALAQLESDLDLAGYDLSDLRGMNNGLTETIKNEIRSQISADFYGVFVYKQYYDTYSQIREIQSQLIHLWTQKYGVDWQRMIRPPLKMIIGGSKSSAPRLTLDLQDDMEKAWKALSAHKIRGKKVESDLYDALGHAPKTKEELEHYKKLAQIGFEIEHLFDDCRERVINTCEPDIVEAINERLIEYRNYREYLKSQKVSICSYKYSDWGKCDKATMTQKRSIIEQFPKGCIEKDKPELERPCIPDAEVTDKTRIEQERTEKERAEKERIKKEKAEEEARKRDEEDAKKKAVPNCSFKYSEWSQCNRETKTRTRTVIAKEPEGCIERLKPVLEQPCTPPPTEEDKRNNYLNCLCRCYSGWAGHIGVFYDPEGKWKPEAPSSGPCFGGLGAWGATRRHFFGPTNDCAKSCYEGAYGKGTWDEKKADELRRKENLKHMQPLKARLNHDKCPIHAQLGDIIDFVASFEGGIPPHKVTWSGEGDAKDEKFTFIKTRQPGTHTVSATVTDDEGNSATASCEVIVDALTVEIEKTSPSENVLPMGSKASFRAVVKSGQTSVSGQLKFLWQPHPEVQFGDDKIPLFETTAPNTTATYTKIGKFPMWVQVLKKMGETYQTVGESDQITIEVMAPELKLTVNKTDPYIGDTVVITVQETPKMSDDIISFWWEIKGDAENPGPVPNIPNSRAYSYKPKNNKPVTVTAHAKSKETGDDLGEASITITAKSYTVSIGEPRYLGPKPKVWKCDTQLGGACPGLVEVPDQQFAVFHDIFMKATVTPALSGAKYDWSVEPKGLCGMPGAGDEIKINCSQTGSFEVSVKVRNADNAEVGRASRKVTVSVSQDEITRAPKAKEAFDKLSEAKKKVAEGLLDQGIGLAEAAKKMDPKNTEAVSLTAKWEADREAITKILSKVTRLVNELKFADAVRELSAAQKLHPKYPPVVEAEAQLKSKEAEEEKKEKEGAERLAKAKDLFKEGKLDEAIKMAEEQARLNPTDKEASTLVKKWKSQKEATDRQVEKIKKLIEASDFEGAKKALATVKEFHPKYPPVVAIEGLLKEREAAHKKEEERKGAEGKQKAEEKKKEENARKIADVKGLVEQGKLSEAVKAAETHAAANPSDQEAVALATKLKTQKEATDRQVKEIEKLIEASDFSGAEKALAKVKRFHPKYRPVLEVESLLENRQAEHKKEEERKRAEEVGKRNGAFTGSSGTAVSASTPSSKHYFQLNFIEKFNHKRPIKPYLVDGIPVSGYNGNQSYMVWLSKCKTALNDGVCYPETYQWVVPSVQSSQAWITTNLFWWGNHFAGKPIARITVSGDRGTKSFDIVGNGHTGEWNQNYLKPASGVTIHSDVKNITTYESRFYVARFSFERMKVDKIKIDLLTASPYGDKFGVLAVYGVTLVDQEQAPKVGVDLPGHEKTSKKGLKQPDQKEPTDDRSTGASVSAEERKGQQHVASANIIGKWVFNMEWQGKTYSHDLNVLSQDANGAITGNGGYPAGKTHEFSWTIMSGSYGGGSISFKVSNTFGAPGRIMEVIGGMNNDGSMSGTWIDNHLGENRSGKWNASRVNDRMTVRKELVKEVGDVPGHENTLKKGLKQPDQKEPTDDRSAGAVVEKGPQEGNHHRVSPFDGDWLTHRQHKGCCNYAESAAGKIFTDANGVTWMRIDRFGVDLKGTVVGRTYKFTYGTDRGGTFTLSQDGNSFTGWFYDKVVKHQGSFSGKRNNR